MKSDLRGTQSVGLDWIQLVQDRVSSEGSIKARNLLIGQRTTSFPRSTPLTKC